MAHGRGGRLLLAMAIVASVVVLSASPAETNHEAGATHEEWGFWLVRPGTAAPGIEMAVGIMRQASFEVPYAGSAEPLPIRIADEQCGIHGQLAVIDGRGRVVSVSRYAVVSWDNAAFAYLEDAPFTPPGFYSLRIECVYGQGLSFGRSLPGFDDLPSGLNQVTKCKKFRIVAPGNLGVGAAINTFLELDSIIPIGPASVPPLYRGDPCPRSWWWVTDRVVTRLSVLLSGLLEERSAALIAIPPATTSSTTKPKSAPPTTQATAAGDQVAPSVSGVQLSANLCANNKIVNVQVSASDNVGVASVSFSWSSSGGASGSGTLAGGPSTFSGSFTNAGLAGGQTVTVTATAHDGAGNSSAPVSNNVLCA